ncbi:Uma2 family endonuclease [Phormidesmis priestleyi]
MNPVKPRLTFEEYLEYDDETDNRYELIDGALIALPPESEPNDFLAVWLQFELAKLINLRLVKTHTCEIQVSVLQAGDAQNRFPDLVVLREEHLALTQKRLTIKLDMPPPLFVAEVVSPGQTNRNRDYQRKRHQYFDRDIAEYWILDPDNETVTVFQLNLEQNSQQYVEVGQFQGNDLILSDVFPDLQLTVDRIFSAGR